MSISRGRCVTTPLRFKLWIHHGLQILVQLFSTASAYLSDCFPVNVRVAALYLLYALYNTHSYPPYKRSSPDNGRQVSTITMRIGGSCINQEVDNRWIVPYNKLLLCSMNCHVNVGLCISIKSIKYVLKDVHKGCDQACSLYSPAAAAKWMKYQIIKMPGTYVICYEAAWRILEFPIHEKDPPVQQLAVHLENGQRVYFTEDTLRNQASRDPPKTTLTDFLHYVKLIILPRPCCM